MVGLLEFDNPFMESQTDLINKVPKEIISEKAATSVKNACSVGKKQCLDFIKETLQQWRPANVNLGYREEEQIGSFPIQEYCYCA